MADRRRVTERSSQIRSQKCEDEVKNKGNLSISRCLYHAVLFSRMASTTLMLSFVRRHFGASLGYETGGSTTLGCSQCTCTPNDDQAYGPRTQYAEIYWRQLRASVWSRRRANVVHLASVTLEGVEQCPSQNWVNGDERDPFVMANRTRQRNADKGSELLTVPFELADLLSTVMAA